MTAIWSREAKYRRWLEVELAVVWAHATNGAVPKDALEEIKRAAHFDLDRCDEIEKETRHDLMAFVRNLSENIGPSGRFVHLGLTSYDVIDTALGMMLRDSTDVLIASAGRLRAEG